MSRLAYENRYCNPCKQTTRHEWKETCCTCLRCGVLKTPTRATPSADAIRAKMKHVLEVECPALLVKS